MGYNSLKIELGIRTRFLDPVRMPLVSFVTSRGIVRTPCSSVTVTFIKASSSRIEGFANNMEEGKSPFFIIKFSSLLVLFNRISLSTTLETLGIDPIKIGREI